LGDIYLTRSQIEEGGWIARSKEEFNKVIAAYQTGNNQLTDLAGYAYARLGLICPEGDMDRAVSNTKRLRNW
jgi:hypothetical protein